MCEKSSSEPLWEDLKRCFIYKRIPGNHRATCGKILAHAKQQVILFRQQIGTSLCVFKIGVTSSPAQRFQEYWEKNFTMMWIVFMSEDLGLVHMLEAALISEFHHLSGCRNAANTGGEGALTRTSRPDPPFFVYVTGGRADQLKRVG